jgi:uncharacterized protein (TIGR03435 family)
MPRLLGHCAALLTISAAAWCQPASPVFEVASVKATAPDAALRHATTDPGRYECWGCSLVYLLDKAYGREPYEVFGPDWMSKQRFDIAATIPKGAGKEQIPAMLQDLLAKRFKLMAHQTQKELNAYVMTVDKGGLKLKPSPDCAAIPEAAQMPIEKNGERVFPPCSTGITRDPSGETTTRKFGNCSMKVLAEDLFAMLATPVSDQTGVTGNYEVLVRYARDPITFDAPSDSASASTPSIYPNLIVAAREQLGLKLTRGKAIFDVLIVDSIERAPAGN